RLIVANATIGSGLFSSLRKDSADLRRRAWIARESPEKIARGARVAWAKTRFRGLGALLCYSTDAKMGGGSRSEIGQGVRDAAHSSRRRHRANSFSVRTAVPRRAVLCPATQRERRASCPSGPARHRDPGPGWRNPSAPDSAGRGDTPFELVAVRCGGEHG